MASISIFKCITLSYIFLGKCVYDDSLEFVPEIRPSPALVTPFDLGPVQIIGFGQNIYSKSKVYLDLAVDMSLREKIEETKF